MDVVAISQAPSPGSNTNPPLPVIASLVRYTNDKLIGQCPAGRVEKKLFRSGIIMSPQVVFEIFPRPRWETKEKQPLSLPQLLIMPGKSPLQKSVWDGKNSTDRFPAKKKFNRPRLFPHFSGRRITVLQVLALAFPELSLFEKEGETPSFSVCPSYRFALF